MLPSVLQRLQLGHTQVSVVGFIKRLPFAQLEGSLHPAEASDADRKDPRLASCLLLRSGCEGGSYLRDAHCGTLVVGSCKVTPLKLRFEPLSSVQQVAAEFIEQRQRKSTIAAAASPSYRRDPQQYTKNKWPNSTTPAREPHWT